MLASRRAHQLVLDVFGNLVFALLTLFLLDFGFVVLLGAN